MPLAIELAAARTQALSVREIADRLDDAFALLVDRGSSPLPRHESLRPTVDWGYALLHPAEQRLLARLSVFAGSFDLEMAEAIDGDDSEALSVLDRLASLADKSFVACLTADARGDMRYRLLETIRQYAREQLEAAGEGAVYADRHLDWYVALVEKAAPELRGASLAAWLDIFEREHDDLRTALQWACNQRRIEAGLRLAGSLERFWWVHGHLSEGRKWLFSLLAQSEPGPEPRAKVIWARALFAAGVLAYRQSDYTQAEDCFESSLQLRREIGDQVGIAFCLNNLGNVALDRGDYAHATALYMQALELRRASKDDWGIASSLNNLGNAAADQGEYARATQLYEQSLALYRQLDDRWSIASTLNNLGEVTQRLGEWRRAERLLRENLALRRELGDERGIALALGNLASLAIAQADWQPAGDLLKESLSRFKRVVDKADVASRFESLALVLNAQAQPGRAARLFGAAEVVRETIHAPLKPNELDDYEAEVEKVRAQLGEPAFTTAWTEGRAMSFDAAVAEALSSPIASPQPAVSVEPVAAPGLRIFALGPTRVTVGDHTLATTDWTYHKARELLFYLVSQPPATKAQIGLDLWPDASEHKLRSLFHRTLHYLRQALGRPDWVVFADGAYTFNRELNCWCDLQVFETLLEEAQAIGWAESKSPTDRAQAIQYLKNATALWRGDFIEDLDAGEWSIYRREELRRSYIGALIDLAQLYFDEAHYHAATDVYQRILSLDNYLEFAHRELMRCYARQGESSWAVRHYQQLRELLRQELQAEPSPETVLLYERIRRGDEV